MWSLYLDYSSITLWNLFPCKCFYLIEILNYKLFVVKINKLCPSALLSKYVKPKLDVIVSCQSDSIAGMHADTCVTNM